MSHPVYHDVVQPSSLPRHHDLALGIVGLLMVWIGLLRLARLQPGWTAGTSEPADRRSTPPVASALGRTAIATSGFGEMLLVSAAVVFLVAVTSLTLLNLIGGASWSWATVDRTIDQVVGIVVSWVVIDP